MSTPANRSRVLYVDQLAAKATEAHVEQLFSEFGPVERVIILKKKYDAKPTLTALVQMESLHDAIAAHDAVADESYELFAVPITVAYSKNQELRDQGTGPASPPVRSRANKNHQSTNSIAEESVNRILLVTVQNPMYPITTDLMGKIFSVYGEVEKIVIFVKSVGLQCLVQFAHEADAVMAKTKLDREAIYPDSCFMLIHYSNLPELVVKENSLKTRDFTNPTLPVPVMDTAINAPHATIALPFIPPSSNDGRPSLSVPQHLHGDLSGEESPVLLVCNLRDSITCDKLFNLFSCYGNITRVKKLHSKPDHALIQFVNETAAGSALTHLRGFSLEGRTLEIRYSKYKFISTRQSDTEDNDSSKEYTNGYNRFTGKYSHYTKHIYSPTKVLHISNFGEELDEDTLRAHLNQYGRLDRVKFKIFFNAKGHAQVIAEFPSIESATNFLAAAHNSEFLDKKLKIAFSRNSSHS
ncbi:hypothetical protein THRCLA_00766 [Thraustotheca clavata]|uniref:RRM domain-containing protein n=1 Tax=Thraustotheca clavata TaxID=74557 RepID=A0A1W0AAA7_9STRA|nr:hypothetical protein THRCLA_00766 [Thraustotheca clavata]